MNHMRKLLAIMEDRKLDNPDISYDLQGDSKSATLSGEFTKITATITGPTSAHFTRLAKKFKQIDDMNKEIKELRDSANAETKEQLNDLFDAEDSTLTRYVETQSLSITVAKDVAEKEVKKETFDTEAFMQDLYELVDESLLPAIQELKEQHTHIQRSIQAGRKGAVKVNVKTEESASEAALSTVERISDVMGELIDLKMSEYGKKLQQLKSRYFSGNLKENNTMNEMRKLMETTTEVFTESVENKVEASERINDIVDGVQDLLDEAGEILSDYFPDIYQDAQTSGVLMHNEDLSRLVMRVYNQLDDSDYMESKENKISENNNYVKTVIDWDGLADAVANDILHGEKHDLFTDNDKQDLLEICEIMRAGIWRDIEDKITSLDTFVRRELCAIIESHTGEEFWNRVGANFYC